MFQDSLTVTFNETIRADTFNVTVCPAQSTWCKKYCYGDKLRGLGYYSTWDRPIVFGRSARLSGYMRPFTIKGDLPAELSDRRPAMEVFNELFPRYKAVWIPTRTWVLEDGMDFVATLLDIHPNVTIMLSYDGSMDPDKFLRALEVGDALGGRVKGSTVIDAPYQPEELAKLQSVLNAREGHIICPKTTHAGTCSTCRRRCWDLSGPSPLVLFNYHR